MGTGEQGGEQVAGGAAVDGLLVEERGLGGECHVRVADGELGLDVPAEGGEALRGRLRIRDGHDGLALARDGVGLVAALDQQQLHPERQFGAQEAGHLLDGVHPFLVDVLAAVAADAAGDAQAQPVITVDAVLGIVFEDRRRVEASGASDAELPLLLGVEVDEGLAAEEAFLDGLGAVHSGLLGDGEEALQPAHGPVALEQGEGRGYAYAVVGSQGGVLGDHPSVLDHVLDRVLPEVVLHPCVLLADHVLVSLEHDGGDILLSGGRLLDNEDVTGLVGLAFEAA